MRKLAAIVIAALALTCGTGARAATAASTARAACGSSLETWFAPQGNGYAGGAGYVVEFSNIGKATCTVKGYPTVRLTENGKQVGLKSRDYASVRVKTVSLRPGQTAHVVLFITDAGVYCRPLPTNGLSVRPPGSARAADFPLVAFGACRGKSTLRVDAINPGVGIPFYTIR
jgi:Protein of unknown function (DUF4232)